jgi:uncharacterized protein (TIGR03067 family)
MKQFAVAGSFLLTALATVAWADEKSLKELEGKYAVTHMEKVDKVAEQAKVDSVKLTITGDELVFTIAGKEESKERKAKIKADSSVTPHTIDIMPTDGDARGKTFPGIYKIEKNVVTLVFTEEGDRPKDFKAEGKAMLLKLKKMK